MNSNIPTYFSSVINLGGLRQVFSVKKANKWGNLIGALITFGVAAASGLYALWAAYSIYQKNGLALLQRDFDENILPFLFVAGLFGLFALGLLWAAFSNWNKALALYNHGIAYHDRKGLKTWHFQHIEGMTAAVTKHYRNGIYTGTTHVYTLWNKADDRLSINDAITNVEEAANQIRQGIYPHLYAAASAAYNAGQPVRFGALTISKAGGIQIGKKTYKWDEIKQVAVDKGYMKISKKEGGWFSGADMPVSVIPNLDVLLSIVDQIVGIKAA